MNVLVDGIVFGRQRSGGGISKVWEEYLRRLPDHGIKIRLVIPFRHTNHSLRRLLQQAEKYDLAQDYLYWPSRFFERVSVRSRILQWLYTDGSIDIFHSTYFSTIYDENIRRVVTVHDMIPELFQDVYQSKWNSFVIDGKRKVLENADRIVAVSYNTKKDLVRLYPWIAEDRIRVIHNGLTTYDSNAGITLETICDKYSISVSPRSYFLFVGRRANYKNFGLILDLLEDHPSCRDYTFLCVGGEDGRKLSLYLQERGLSQNFLFLGFVPDDELAVLYRNALALVYPSRYEGFGLPLLEAMASECPVICSDASCFPEVAGDAAFYFDPCSVDSLAEAITRALRSDRTKTIEQGLGNVARFSWEKSVRALLDLYESLA